MTVATDVVWFGFQRSNCYAREMVPLTDCADLGAEDRDGLQVAVARLVTLEDVIHWGLSLPGQQTVLDVIVQDEYTHDVIMKWRDDFHVVFDTT